ncbi:uncharacterized protein LOC111643846, partial [Copidosoma floridanum]|uniref:uncharacterized protein LOC111643846 n=1 Tax=Copidosoma floridanum TaxID=29053 RepID=UPI000C6FAD70
CDANGIVASENNTIEQLRQALRQFVKSAKDDPSIVVKTWQNLQEKEKEETEAKEEQKETEENEWEKFTDRMEQYFIANDVEDRRKKRAILLSKVNAETYDVVDEVCKPEKPGAKTYDEIVKLVKDYLKPTVSYLVHRTNLDEQVLDQQVVRLQSASIKAEILKLETPTLKEALQKSLATEAANKGVENLKTNNSNSNDPSYVDMHKINTSIKRNFGSMHQKGRKQQQIGKQESTIQRKSQRPESSQEQDSTPKQQTENLCYCCGKANHLARDSMNHDNTVSKFVRMLRYVSIEANNMKIISDVYVSNAESPPIIGRPWLKALKLWPLYLGMKLHENNSPKYLLARTVPFSLKEKVSKELERLVCEGIIEAVETSEWTTPIVPVLKPNSDVRICADFKVTLNPQLITVRHSPPNFDHAVAEL